MIKVRPSPNRQKIPRRYFNRYSLLKRKLPDDTAYLLSTFQNDTISASFVLWPDCDTYVVHNQYPLIKKGQRIPVDIDKLFR